MSYKTYKRGTKNYRSHRTEISENLKTNEEIRNFLNNLHPTVLSENSFLRDMKAKMIVGFTLGQRRGITNWMKNEKLTKKEWEEYQEKFKPILLKLETVYKKLNDVGADEVHIKQVEKYKNDLGIYNYISKTRMKRVNDIFMKYFPEI